MAGSRTVYRGSKGRFAGASVGKPEKVRAGGFANAAFRARVQASRKATANSARPPLASRGKPSSSKKNKIGNFVKKHPHATGVALGYAAIGASAGIGAARASSKRASGVRRTTSLVHANANLFRQNSKSTNAIINRSLGRLG